MKQFSSSPVDALEGDSRVPQLDGVRGVNGGVDLVHVGGAGFPERVSNGLSIDKVCMVS